MCEFEESNKHVCSSVCSYVHTYVGHTKQVMYSDSHWSMSHIIRMTDNTAAIVDTDCRQWITIKNEFIGNDGTYKWYMCSCIRRNVCGMKKFTWITTKAPMCHKVPAYFGVGMTCSGWGGEWRVSLHSRAGTGTICIHNTSMVTPQHIPTGVYNIPRSMYTLRSSSDVYTYICTYVHTSVYMYVCTVCTRPFVCFLVTRVYRQT